MKMSSDKKKQMLLETFETLKNNFISNDESLAKLIGKMAKIDIDTAIEMWKYILNKYPSILKSSNYYISVGIMFSIEESIGEVEIYKLIVEDEILKKCVFKDAGRIFFSPVFSIRHYFEINELYIANELLTLVKNNKHHNSSLYEILDEVVPEDCVITGEAFDLLNEWISKVKDKEQKAKLNLKMMDLADYEEENDDE